jgi:hypothetical protein
MPLDETEGPFADPPEPDADGDPDGPDAVALAIRHMWRALALSQDPFSTWRQVHAELMDAAVHAGVAAAEEEPFG